MKINNLNISKLSSGNFYQYIESVVSIAKTEPAAANFISKLDSKIALMQTSFKKDQLTGETAKILELDKIRDRAFTKTRWFVEAFAIDDRTPANITAAESLLVLYKRYEGGNLINFDYNKETAYLTNFVKDFRTNYATEITTLNLKDDVDYIETCNDNFKNFYGTRNDLQTQLQNIPPFYKIRQEITDDYKNFVADLESLYRNNLSLTPQLESLGSRINVEIANFLPLIPVKATKPAPAAVQVVQENEKPN